MITIGVGWATVALTIAFVFGRMCKARNDFEERLEQLEEEADARAQVGE